jgi:hypothetical protein
MGHPLEPVNILEASMGRRVLIGDRMESIAERGERSRRDSCMAGSDPVRLDLLRVMFVLLNKVVWR